MESVMMLKRCGIIFIAMVTMIKSLHGMKSLIWINKL